MRKVFFILHYKKIDFRLKLFYLWKKTFMKKIYLFLALIFSILSTTSFAQSCNPLTINMYDSFGDGWNGNDLTFTSNENINKIMVLL